MVGLETRPLKAFFFKGSRTTPYENFRIYLERSVFREREN